MNNLLIKHMAFPLQEKLLGRPTFKYLRQLEKTQWRSLDEIRDMQFLKLKKLLTHAFSNVAFYRNKFESIGLHPEDIKNFEDLKKIPILTKKEVRNNILSLKAPHRSSGVKRRNTSGTTGESLVFYLDNVRMAYDKAAKFRFLRWWGVDIGDKEVLLWGSPLELSTQSKLKTLRDKMFNSILLSAFDMSEDSMKRYVDILRRFKPKMIEAYPSSIYLLAKFIKNKAIDIGKLDLKVISCTGETLYGFQKTLVEEVFNCSVVNSYGLREAGLIATQCPEGGFHICAENLYVEVVPREGCFATDSPGDIIVTNLDMYSMPFIRYKTDDIGVLSDEICSCGRKLPILKYLKGRSSDFFLTPSGKFIHGLAFDYILEEIEGIERFKLIQKTRDFLLVKIVKLPTFELKKESLIIEKLKKLIGADVTIDLEYVSRIEPEKSGKYRYVVSKIAQEKLENPAAIR